MEKHLELIGPSCLTAAQDDEPLFVLRANDELAPGIVREWALRYYNSKMDRQGKLTPGQKEKKEGALRVATRMELWVVERARKAREKKKGASA